MSEECFVCGAPLCYLSSEEMMECAICHKTEPSRTRCVSGHYVCSDCHTCGLADIFQLCQAESSQNPIEILQNMMALPFCHMHGPEHHVLVGAALLTAFRNAGGQVDLPSALQEMYQRGKAVPGGACGFWGACGAGISTGQFLSIVTKSTPLATTAWGLSNQMTSQALSSIGAVGGPRCCKRNSYLAVLAAVVFVREHLQVNMTAEKPVCKDSSRNNQCLRQGCPFYGGR